MNENSKNHTCENSGEDHDYIVAENDCVENEHCANESYAGERGKNGQGSPKPARNKIGNILVATIAFFIAIIVFFAGFFVGNCNGAAADKASEIIRLINKYAVAVDGEADKDDVARAIVGYVLKDDKYARYYSEKEYKTLLAEDKGVYAGFGLSFLVDENGRIVGDSVYAVQQNSPAYHAGVKTGDKFVRATTSAIGADGSKVPDAVFADNSELAEFMGKIPENGSATFYVTRAGEFTEKPFVIAKETYTATYVNYYDGQKGLYFYSAHGAKTEPRESENGVAMLPDDAAVIELYGFEGDAAREFKQALDYMRMRGKTKLILDLRDNGGGLMTTLSDIASYLIRNGGKRKSLIAVAVDKKGAKQNFYTSGNAFYDNIEQIAVLANANTASASECLIGALEFYGGANDGASFSEKNLVLTYNPSRDNFSTYGKGIMQTTYSLATGGAFKITTAYIYQPDEKTCIHDVGLTTSVPENRVDNENALSRAIDVIRTNG